MRFVETASRAHHRESQGPTRGALGATAACALVLAACGDGTGPSAAATVTVTPEIVIVDSIGRTTQFTALVRDDDGTRLSGLEIAWASNNSAVATIDARSGLATAGALGSTTITAMVGAASGRATLDVFVPSDPVFLAGEIYFGRQQYVEYQAGDLPIVISAPHGGYIEAAEIRDRTYGVVTQDSRTQEVARALASAISQLTGRHPHVVINRLHRIKLDPNREIVEAAQGNAFAEWAWSEHHGFVDAAKQAVEEQYGRGFYVDLHGHGHEIQRLELGYLLRASDLALPDALLGAPSLVDRSSIRALALDADAGFAELIRGPTSLGGLLAAQGFPGVPSPAQPGPDGAPFFSGGYSTARHGSRDGGSISGVQVEMHWVGLRESMPGTAA